MPSSYVFMPGSSGTATAPIFCRARRETKNCGESGLYYIEDRRREAITSRGILVSSREIEKLIESVDGVREVAVVGISEETGNEYILAVVSSEAEGDTLISRIMQACRKSLSPYKIPRKIEFRKELPKSMSGKVLKRQIIEEHLRQVQ